ncbi:hypothetical protein H2248_005450 [Termitomyces sp. 'cryptogamus']|nr:hypothetical protein H2248_005450 [Termitomyces sp. 'cryptogamus']
MFTVPRQPDSSNHSVGPSSHRADFPQYRSSHLSSNVRYPHLEDDLYEPHVITYDRLEQQVTDFDHQLGHFIAECRRLGRSYALILAARDLREGLEKILDIFYQNATYLAPSLPARRPNPNTANEPFYSLLEALAKVCDTFYERLNEFREYTNETAKVKTLMRRFSKDLMDRASCFEKYQESLDTTDMRHHINDLAGEMGRDFDNLASAFTFFNRYGMPAMQYEQKRSTEILVIV